MSARVESFGTVDLVINIAGVTPDKSLMNMTAAEFDDVVTVHLRGTWLMCRSAARARKSTGGSILNVTSGSALWPRRAEQLRGSQGRNHRLDPGAVG
jgi:NAD(P)-dependent dehydrogenase (short-subunit alcohol dehydrogenase family)